MMKSCLFSTIYLEGEDSFGNSRLWRTVRWINWYRELKKDLGFENFILSDNGSSLESLAHLSGMVYNEMGELIMDGDNKDIIIHTHAHSLVRIPNIQHGYPYCWRGLYDMARIAETCAYDKIIRIDTDAFVLTADFASFIKTRVSGWTAMWCPRWKFPEDAISILCRDTYSRLIDFCQGDYMQHIGKQFETTLPFTILEISYSGDRYGEEKGGLREQDFFMNFYCQANLKTKLEFRS